MIELAKEYAIKYHGETGETRSNGLPYHTHCENTVKLLREFGVKDEKTLCKGWLHDTLEDTRLTLEEIENVFGKDVAKGVYILTRNVGRFEYKLRLLNNPDELLIKFCDTIDNLQDLSYYTTRGLYKKILDTEEFYIPQAKKICEPAASEMELLINNFYAIK